MKHFFKKVLTGPIMIIAILGMINLTSCDTELDAIDTSYSQLSVKVDFQADKSAEYYATVNDENISFSSPIFLSKSNSSIILKVYRKGVDTPELEENIEIQKSAVISLVQLPGASISIASSEEEVDPNTRNRVKVRFFYSQEDLGSSLKIGVFGTDGGGDMSSWDEITSFTMEKGKFTDYIELDMAKYYTPETAAAGEYHDPLFSLDVTDIGSGEKIIDYTTLGLSVDLVGQLPYEPADENGGRSGYKFMSNEMVLDKAAGYGYFNVVFGTPWE